MGISAKQTRELTGRGFILLMGFSRLQWDQKGSNENKAEKRQTRQQRHRV